MNKCRCGRMKPKYTPSCLTCDRDRELTTTAWPNEQAARLSEDRRATR